jgi:hypothetical protein
MCLMWSAATIFVLLAQPYVVPGTCAVHTAACFGLCIACHDAFFAGWYARR